MEWPFIIIAFVAGYAWHRVSLNLGGKAVYSETDLVQYGEQQYQEGLEEGIRGL